MDLISKEWKPTLTAMWILEVLYAMLKEPSSDSPLEADIAQLMQSNPEEFKKKAQEWTQKFAS